jgi:hypothetical protein
MYFHELKAVIENGLEWSAEFPENHRKSIFLSPKKILKNFILITIFPIFLMIWIELKK